MQMPILDGDDTITIAGLYSDNPQQRAEPRNPLKSEQLFGGIYPFDEHMFASIGSLCGNQREESEMKSNPKPHDRRFGLDQGYRRHEPA